MSKIKHRPFLKWAGGKFRLIDDIKKVLPKGECLVEPFIGGGSLFLNTDFERYFLADVNQDLINLYNIVKNDLESFLVSVEDLLFHPRANSKDFYLACREQFNKTEDPFEKSVLFLYLNRYGYNGLCRYNNNGEFNVPFGSYKKIYFPEKELVYFSEKSKQAEFFCGDFREVFNRVHSEEIFLQNTVFYCDPPYAPLQKVKSSHNFTHYAQKDFTFDDHKELANLAQKSTALQQSVVISNHYSSFTKEIYQEAKLKKIKVQRSIAQKSSARKKVVEILATFKAKEISGEK